MGILDAIFQTAVPILGARTAGRNEGFLDVRKLRQEDEDRKREAARAAQQDQLFQLELAKAQRPEAPAEWHPTSMQEYQQVHPQTPVAQRNVDPLSNEGRAATLSLYRDKAAIDARAPKPPSEAADAREARGTSILSLMGQGGGGTNEQKHAFTRAYAAIIARHPDWSSGKVADAAYSGTVAVDPTLKPARQSAEDSFFAGMGAAPADTSDAAVPGVPGNSGPDTTASLGAAAIPSSPKPAASTPQDRWEALVASGTSTDEATAKVKAEFGLR